MLYFSSVILSISCLIRKNSRIIFFLLFLLLWIMFGWSHGNADYLAYASSYDNLSYFDNFSEGTIGLKIIFSFFSSIGISYQWFLIIISFFGLALIAYTIRKYSQYGCFVFLLYFIFPYLLDIVQIKNFLVTALIVYAVRYLVSEEKGSVIKYIVIVCMATLIHYSAVFFLLLLLVKYFDFKTIAWITVIVSVVILITYKTNLFIVITSKIAPSSWVTTRLDQGVNDDLSSQILRIVRMSFILFLFIYLKRKVIQYIKKHEYNLEANGGYKVDNTETFRFIDIVSKTNVLVAIAIPLLMYSREFYRIQQDILILNYMVFSLGFNKSNQNKSGRLVMSFIMVIYCMVSLYIMVLRNDNLFTVFRPMFENNLLFP